MALVDKPSVRETKRLQTRERRADVPCGVDDVCGDDEIGRLRPARIVRIETLEGSVMAWTFVLDAYEGGLPGARYLGDLGDAAERAGAPSDYVQSLRLRPCRSNP